MTFNRRSFIKISSATVGGAALGSGLLSNMWGLTPDVIADPGTAGDQVIPTFCEICFWKCGVLAHVKNGRVTKLEGNPEHPLSNGRLCPRGTGGTGLLYDPDRLKQPLLRRSKRGEDVFEAVSWEAALDHTAEKLMALKEKHGPEALALFSHGYGGSWFKTLMKAYGSANVTAPSYAQCRGSREVAFELTYGTDVGSPEVLDLANSRVITLIGSHLGENMHNTQVQDFTTAIDRGAEIIVVDPRFSTAAGKAKYWLPIKPGTDVALLLAWMHVIINERLYDKAYLDQYALGFDELTAHVADKTPEWAFVHTGIEPERIRETARFIAGARPASLVHPGRRSSWNGNDTQRGRSIAILNALLGNWGRKGGIYLPTAMPVPGFKSNAHPEHTPKTPADMPKGVVYPFAKQTLAHGLRDASIPGTSAYDIKGWFVYGTNLLQSLPQPEKTKEALRNLDFVVTVDVLPAEICGWSDVVLPEATYLERYDDLTAPPYRQGFVALRQPVIPPMYESKPGWWIAKELGKRMGYADFYPFEDAEEYIAKRVAAAGQSLVELKTHGVIKAPPEPIYIEDGVAPNFATPSGKIELFSQQMADAGLPPLPPFAPPPEIAPGQFQLLFGRAPNQTFGRTTNNRVLAEAGISDELWLNAKVAKEQGFTNGTKVVMINQDGVRSDPIALKVTQRIRPDCVYMIHGYGHESKGLNFAKGRGADDTKLVTSPAIDPVMGGTGLNTAIVRIERA
ncbi:MAG: molybdopterin-dependent oxidoreductase [Myxococcales bacterium]|nr:molybdopterin-dependent oxidoreductase [Myxococcales bacterium]